jgi:Ca2+-transporting ATPase
LQKELDQLTKVLGVIAWSALGATSVINTDKTGTLTLNRMMVSNLYAGGLWYTVEGQDYRKSGEIRSVAGTPEPECSNTPLPLGVIP